MALPFRHLRPAAEPPRAGVELSAIKAIELRASRLPDTVSLAQGIPSFDTPEPIGRYVQQKIAEGACSKYSVAPGLPELRELISEQLRGDAMAFDPDGEILVTCGAIEAVSATLLATVGRGDEVVLTSPTYASYVPAVRLTGAEPRFAALDEDANFDLDPDAIARVLTRRTRAILFCNPNNPTGTVFSAAQIESVLELAERHDLLVISDEVYRDFVYGDTEPARPAQWARFRHRVVSIWSFSKAYSMTGWRVGFLAADRRHVDNVLRVHDALVTCAPVVSQYAAIAALQFGAPSVQRAREEYRARRRRIIERLDQLPHIFDYQRPNASYFVFPRIKDTVPLARDSQRLAHDILERVRVAVVPGIAFGPTGEAHLRLCYARSEREIDVACDRLQEYFDGQRARPAAPAPLTARRAASLKRRAGVAVLRGLARAYLARQRPRTIVIAGNRGKTVIKRALIELLDAQLHARANPLSYNTDVGVPLAVLDLQMNTQRWPSVAAAYLRGAARLLSSDGTDVLVLELGARHAGDIARHLQLVRPSIAVITALTPSYSREQVELATLRSEVAQLCLAVQATGGDVLLCGDDPSLCALAQDLPGAVLFSKAHLQGDDGARWLEIDGERYAVGREVAGDSSIHALEIAACVGRRLGVADAALRAFLERRL